MGKLGIMKFGKLLSIFHNIVFINFLFIRQISYPLFLDLALQSVKQYTTREKNKVFWGIYVYL